MNNIHKLNRILSENSVATICYCTGSCAASGEISGSCSDATRCVIGGASSVSAVQAAVRPVVKAVVHAVMHKDVWSVVQAGEEIDEHFFTN